MASQYFILSQFLRFLCSNKKKTGKIIVLQNIVKIYIGIVLILLKKEFVVFFVGGAVQKEKPIIPVNKSPHLKILAD